MTNKIPPQKGESDIDAHAYTIADEDNIVYDLFKMVIDNIIDLISKNEDPETVAKKLKKEYPGGFTKVPLRAVQYLLATLEEISESKPKYLLPLLEVMAQDDNMKLLWNITDFREGYRRILYQDVVPKKHKQEKGESINKKERIAQSFMQKTILCTQWMKTKDPNMNVEKVVQVKIGTIMDYYETSDPSDPLHIQIDRFIDDMQTSRQSNEKDIQIVYIHVLNTLVDWVHKLSLP